LDDILDSNHNTVQECKIKYYYGPIKNLILATYLKEAKVVYAFKDLSFFLSVCLSLSLSLYTYIYLHAIICSRPHKRYGGGENIWDREKHPNALIWGMSTETTWPEIQF
jgi:hypothetical protein